MQQPRNFTLAGAVDLGARQNATKRRQQAQAQAAGGEAGMVIEVTDETFNTEVVDRSRAVPVIVDLWAEWCGPCKQLGPVLEKLAAEANGDWVLAKVDVDANPQLSAALQVQSIPMVVAVIGGQLVDGFLGALPEAQVREWIAQILTVAEQLGMPPRAGGDGAEADGDMDEAATESGTPFPGDEAGAAGSGPGASAGSAGPPGAASAQPVGRPEPAGGPQDMLADPGLRAAQEAMDAGDMDGAAEALNQVLASSPGHPLAVAWLAQVDLLRRVRDSDPAAVRDAATARPDDPAAQASMADIELAAGRVDQAFDRLLGVVQRTTGTDRDAARMHLIGLFEILPPRDPQVAKARARLSSLLF